MILIFDAILISYKVWELCPLLEMITGYHTDTDTDTDTDIFFIVSSGVYIVKYIFKSWNN